MRKFFVKITTLLLVGVVCLSSLFGCNLISTNNQRDMSQVVAKIKIEDAPTTTIYKRDVVLAYNNYVGSGYTGESNSEVFTEVIESLIQNAVLVQYAMRYFANKEGFDGTKWELATYLTEEELLDCKYSAYLQFEQLINDYVKEKEEEKVGDTYSGDVRVVPTGATNDTKVSAERKQNYVDTFWSETVMNKYGAYVKTINALKKNDLLGNYVYGDIASIEYFNQILVAYQEGVLVDKLQEDIEKEARKVVKYESVENEYKRLYEIQNDANPTEFKSIVNSVSAENPILKGQGEYGMVYHILLKAEGDVADKLDELKETYKNKETSEYKKERGDLFKDITAKDQRASWIKSKYDFGATTTKLSGYNYELAFTGDYTLNKDASLPFFGSVTHLNSDDVEKDDYRARYRVDSVDTLSVSQVLEIINQYVYNGTAKFVEEDDTLSDELKVQDRAVYTASDIADDYDNRVKELMFAFSQDDSNTALNTYKGYAIPGDWMEEFSEAGAELIKKDEKTFMLVATDYGYHIMFFSEYFDEDYDYDCLEDYLNKEFKFSTTDITSWEEEFNYMVENYNDYENTDNYMYILYNKLVAKYIENAYQNETQKIYADYAYNSRVVVKYPDAYKDLVK